MSGSIDDLADALDDLSIDVQAFARHNESLVPTGQRPCPICGEKMSTESRGPATVDVCAQHGMWLDNGELHSILDAARARTAKQYRSKIDRAERDGRVSGALLGVWALALD